MTHHTDAERAEFELMRFAFESKGSEAYKAWLIEVRDGDSYKPWDVVNDWRSWQTAWQAARRAPAVPQEPTSKQVVLGAGALLGQPEHTADNRHPEWHSAVEKVRKVYLAMLAAAPQPPEGLKRENPATKPEAAPVQLPEPVAKVESGSLKWHIPSAGYSLPVRYLQGNHMLYTEQQVRELLAAQAAVSNGTLASQPPFQTEAGASRQLEEIAVLAWLLVRALRKADPANPRAARALDYLKRHGLQGNPLRAPGD